MPLPPGVVPPLLRAAVQRANHPRFFFVNIGAYDGVSNDYVFPFLRDHRWRGLAVEPFETSFRELERNYTRFPDVILERAAITEHPRPLHVLRPPADFDRHWVTQIGALDRAVLLNTIEAMRIWQMDGPVPDDLENAIVSVDVPCLSFTALMQKHHVEHIDLLCIDAEGSDYEIFCSIDLERYRPRLLVIETDNMSPTERADFDERLEAAGYVFLTRPDFLTEVFVAQDLLRRMRWRDRLRSAVARAWEGRRRG